MSVVPDPSLPPLAVVVGAVALALALVLWAIPPARRSELAKQIVLITPAWLAYFAIRGAIQPGVASAVARGQAIIEFEQRLGISVEPWLNDQTMRAGASIAVGNVVYLWGHWPLIFVVAVWLFTRHPAAFRRYERAFLVSGAIGLACFFLFPTAPPRLAGAEVVDTVTAYSNVYRVLQPPALTNQYAAFPSLHVGWNLLIGIALARHGQRPGLLLGVLSPAAMALAAVATGNHYVVDLAGGIVVALIGLAVAIAWEQDVGTRLRRAGHLACASVRRAGP